MIKYKLTDRLYIRNLDSKNWVYCREDTSKVTGETYEKVLGYASTLNGIWKLAVDETTLTLETNQELLDTIEKLNKLKEDIILNEGD